MRNIFLKNDSQNVEKKLALDSFALILIAVRFIVSCFFLPRSSNPMAPLMKFTLISNTIGLLQLSNQNPWSLSTANLQRQTEWHPEISTLHNTVARRTDTEKDILILQSFWFIKLNFHPFFCVKLDMRNINLNINERPKRTATRKVRPVSFKKHINPNKTAEQPSLATKLSSK